MTQRPTITILLLLLLSSTAGLVASACGPDGCSTIDEDPDFCESHPFGPAPEAFCPMNGREPQTVAYCEVVFEANPGLCIDEYLACREALRVAPCGTCPRECEGIARVAECQGGREAGTTP